MAIEKILNTRIQLRYGNLSEWTNGPFNGNDSSKWLKAGELAIVTLAPNKETEPTNTANQHPLLFKVGTGAHKFDDLPWASALAADVYAWAKKPTLDAADLPEIPGLQLNISVKVEGNGNAVTDATWDASTKTLTLTKGETFLKASEFVDTTYSAGTKLELDGTTFNHEATNRADTTSAGNAEFGKTIEVVDSVSSDETGHITAINVKTITLPTPEEVSLPTVTDIEEAGHVVVKVDQTAGAIEVTRKPIEVEHKDGQIYLTINGEKIGTGFSDSDFVKDSFLESVTKNAEENTITFTWNTESGIETTTIDVDELVEVYEGSDTIAIEDYIISVKDNSITETKLTEVVREKLNKEWQPIGDYQPAGDYKTKQTAYAEAGSTIKTITNVTQNANGEIDVTYEDINFPAPPVVNDGKLTIGTEEGVLTGSGEFTANQAGDTKINIAIANKGITTAKIADNAVGADQLKAQQGYAGDDAEVWVFYCGTASEIL